MSVEKITTIGGMTRLKKDKIGFTVSITQVERKIKSLDAKGLYIHLLGYPENWTFYRDHLMDTLNIGKDRFKRCIDELKDLGLVTEIEIRDKKGRFVENQLHVSLGLILDPQFQESADIENQPADILEKTQYSSRNNPEAGYPRTGEPVSGYQPTININNINKHKEEINNADSQNASSASDSTLLSDSESLGLYRWKDWQKIYPDNNQRGRCLPYLRKMSKTEYLKLLEGTKAYLELIELEKKNGFPEKNPMYATTFLRNKVWEDANDILEKFKNKLKQKKNEPTKGSDKYKLI